MLDTFENLLVFSVHQVVRFPMALAPKPLDLTSASAASAIVLLEYGRSPQSFRILLSDLGGLEDQFGSGHAFLSSVELDILHVYRLNLHLERRHVLVRADTEVELQARISKLPCRHRGKLRSRRIVVTDDWMRHYFAAWLWSMRTDAEMAARSSILDQWAVEWYDVDGGANMSVCRSAGLSSAVDCRYSSCASYCHFWVFAGCCQS